MKLFIFLYVGLIAMTVSADEWLPPEKPDVQAILNEAQDDARAGKYDLALAKHLWFHENALKHQPSMSGVRLSFALGYWHELGEHYPPALEKLKQVREETKKRVTADNAKYASFEVFHDLAALNNELDEEADTVEMFKFVEQHNPKAARRIFGVSEPALIKAKEYALCGKYLEPEQSTILILKLFNLDSNRKVDPRFAEHAVMINESRNRQFIEDAATLVALLVINDRKDEAEKAVAKLKTVESDADFHEKLASALDEAFAGDLPEQR